MNNEKEIIDGIRRVHADNVARIVSDPNGDSPECKNILGTWTCERCGNDVRETRGKACPASLPEDRWRFVEA